MPYVIFFFNFSMDFDDAYLNFYLFTTLMDMTLYFSQIFILPSDFLNQAKNHLQLKQRMFHNCYLCKATEWNCTSGINNCINEILVAYWIPAMLLLSQPYTALLYSNYDNEESLHVFYILYPTYSIQEHGLPCLTGGKVEGRWPLAKDHGSQKLS